MNEDQIKSLRHSFTNPYREDLPKTKVNQFGHTILSESQEEVDTSNIEVKIDESGQIRADMTTSLFDTQKVSEWAKMAVNIAEFEAGHDTNVETSVNKYSSLIAELDELEDGTAKKKNSSKDHAKNCVNKNCLYSLPKDANFCLKCGTAQLPKFCVECGYNFKSEEKFCPDCGNKR